MKTFILILFAAAVFLAPVCLADFHEFTSSDGSNTLSAEVQGYDAESKTVTLLLADRSRITSPVSAFSEEDQAYIQKAALALEAGRNLAVRFSDAEEEISEKRNATNGYRTVELKSGFELELRNNGQETFKGLTADYQIFYAAYLNPFQDRARTDQASKGSVLFPELEPRAEATVKTDTVDMTRITRLPLSQCTGGT